MTDYVTTWWERTGKMTEFGDGISSPIFRNMATGEERSSRDLPVGALYAIERRDGRGPNDYPPVGGDGYAIACKCTDHIWCIDGRASNCTKKNDNEHRCWVRHGTIGDKLTVDKNGNTCAAGAGSFYMDDNRWHGFLTKGVMSPQQR